MVVSIILLLLVSITLSNPIYAAEGGPKLVSSLEKIILTKDTGIIYHDDNDATINFNLFNIGNDTAKNVQIKFANLTIIITGGFTKFF